MMIEDRRGESGFTLIELLVVVAVISILAGSVTLGYQSFTRTSALRGDKILLAAYMRTAQRQTIVHRKDACFRIVEASAQGATNESVEARFLAFGASCNATNWAAGSAIPGLGVFIPSKTVDIHFDPATMGNTDKYEIASYTQTGQNYSIHVCDNLDSSKYGTVAGEGVFSTFTSISTTGRVEVFPCGRNNPFSTSAWC